MKDEQSYIKKSNEKRLAVGQDGTKEIRRKGFRLFGGKVRALKWA